MRENDEDDPLQSSSTLWWSAIFLAVFCAVGGGWLAWNLFVKAYPSYAVGDFLGFWGLVSGLLGVVVSVAGFGFGLAQLRRTRTASRAAILAVRQFRRSYASFELLQLLSHAQELSKQAGDHLTGSRYPEMVVCYRDLQANLWRMGSTKGVLSARYNENLKDLAGEAGDAYSILTAKARDPTAEFDTIRFERWLQMMDNILIEVDLELRSEAYGK